MLPGYDAWKTTPPDYWEDECDYSNADEIPYEEQFRDMEILEEQALRVLKIAKKHGASIDDLKAACLLCVIDPMLLDDPPPRYDDVNKPGPF